MREAVSVAIAAVFGAFIGALVGLELASSLGMAGGFSCVIGMFVGGIGGWILQAPKQFAASVTKAWDEADVGSIVVFLCRGIGNFLLDWFHSALVVFSVLLSTCVSIVVIAVLSPVPGTGESFGIWGGDAVHQLGQRRPWARLPRWCAHDTRWFRSRELP